MATKKNTKRDPLKSKTEWSITEFQMWLHGAYSLQGEDWVPNAEQWEMIVDIIYKLKNPVAKKIANNIPSYPSHQPMEQYNPPIPYQSELPMNATASSMFNQADVPPEANMSLSELKRLRESSPSNSNVLAGNAAPGEKTVKIGTFE